MKREYDFRHAKRARFRGLPPEAERARHTKVRITIMLDQDILQFFKAQAAQSGAEPYQTQINRALREYISAGSPRLKTDLLSDDAFISRIAERVAGYPARKRARVPPARKARTA